MENLNPLPQQQIVQHIDPEGHNDDHKEIKISEVEIVKSQIIEISQPAEEIQKQDEENQVQEAQESLDNLIDQSIATSQLQNANSNNLVISQNTNEIAFSMTEMQIRENYEASLFNYQSARNEIKTKIIVKNEENEGEKNKKQYEDDVYYMGYFKWYWGRYGFIRAFVDFFGKKIVRTLVYSVFYNAGFTIGYYFFKKHFIIPNGFGQYT